MMTVQLILRRRGWTEADLAARLGVATSVVRGWEEGRSDPNDRQLAVVARVLGVPEQVLTDPVVLDPGPGGTPVAVARVVTSGLRVRTGDGDGEEYLDGDDTAPRGPDPRPGRRGGRFSRARAAAATAPTTGAPGRRHPRGGGNGRRAARLGAVLPGQ